MCWKYVLAVVAVLCSLAAARATEPTGTFSLDQTNLIFAGDTISFSATIAGLPTYSGASWDSWIEVVCVQDGSVVFAEYQPTYLGSTVWPVRMTMLWPGLGAADCIAYYYWQNYQHTRRSSGRRTGNTLGSLTFHVGAAS